MAETTPAAGTPSATPPSSASPSPAPTPSAGGGGTATVQLESLATGFRAPIGITSLPGGGGELFVVEQGGTVRRATPPSGGAGPWVVESEPFLDLTGRVSAGGEQGLLGVAFHPGHAQNRRLFAHYTDLNGDTVLAEYQAPVGGGSVDSAAERVLLQVDQPYPNHNGGALAFGPDGYLYLALGDGGSANDPHGHGQNTETLLGSILRLDVDRADAQPYAIPPDNPFAGGGGRPELWVYGLRNPWRLGFDRATGDLYIGDVGQGSWEEIDRQAADSPGGENYGWNIMEGAHCFRDAQCDTTGLMLPIAEYGHEAGECTVIGGYVYRGEAFPELRGGYLYADWCSGRMWMLDPSAAPPVPRLVAETGLQISSFGEDEAGELYLVEMSAGGLYRVRPGP